MGGVFQQGNAVHRLAVERDADAPPAGDISRRYGVRNVTIRANCGLGAAASQYQQKQSQKCSLSGNSMTSSIGPDERNQHPLEGVVEGDRITLTTLPRPGRTVAFTKCHLIVHGETLKGTIERVGSSDGTIAFRRVGGYRQSDP